MKKLSFTKVICVAVVTLLLTANLSAAPKKKSKKQKSKFDSVQVQKNSKGKVWNLGGIDIQLIDWWSGPDAEGGEPRSTSDAELREWHKWSQEKYNYKLKQCQISGWDSHPQTVSNFCITGGDENYIFIIDNRSVISGMRAGLYYDLSKVTDVDWSNEKWDRSTREIMSKGSKFYSMRPIIPEPRGGVFFNKRLLEEAGIDPEEPYNLQKEGKWTWETFEDLVAKCTRDIDNDGIMDIWGMANSSTEFVPLAVMSNGTAMIGRDANGKYINNIGTDKSLEALKWCAHMATNYEKPQPEGSEWNWMYPAFVNGEVAFQVDQEYHAQPNGTYAQMKDDFGFVCFPLGPSGDGKYKTLHNDNLYVLPSCYDDEKAAKIVKAFDLWTEPVPGAETDENGEDISWKEGYYTCFRDSRAVDETLALMKENPNPRYDTLIPDINYMGDVIWVVYPGYVEPQQAYEDTINTYKGLLDYANR